MVSKRLRFEILRRDGFRCVYCGATPLESLLEVDHVVPVTLGGTDDPENLATACEACNSGKTSTAPNSEILAAMNLAVAAEQAARAHVASVLQSDVTALNAYEDDVLSIWSHHVPEFRRASPWDIACITEWHRDGIPLELVELALRLAISANVPWTSKAAYSVGIVRNKAQEVRNANPLD